MDENEFAEGLKKFPKLKQFGRATIEYGENKDGYWTSDKFIEQIKYCVDIAECKYPKSEGYKVVWVFDHSSGLGAYSEDALNASQMNVKPGGKQPVICNTVWQGKEQRMVFNICIPKGLVYRC